jgi:hypothetical protein
VALPVPTARGAEIHGGVGRDLPTTSLQCTPPHYVSEDKCAAHLVREEDEEAEEEQEQEQEQEEQQEKNTIGSCLVSEAMPSQSSRGGGGCWGYYTGFHCPEVLFQSLRSPHLLFIGRMRGASAHDRLHMGMSSRPKGSPSSSPTVRSNPAITSSAPRGPARGWNAGAAEGANLTRARSISSSVAALRGTKPPHSQLMSRGHTASLFFRPGR